MATKKSEKEAERFVHPEEAAMAAHHLKMYHNIKQDKDLHKAAKEHVKKEHEALGAVLGKKEEKVKLKAKGKK
jgi:hypothetical protein